MIEVKNRMPAAPAINATLTGAARRSTENATAAAVVYFAALESAEKRLIAAVNQPPSAAAIAEALRAVAAIPEPPNGLSAYWVKHATVANWNVMHLCHTWPIHAHCQVYSTAAPKAAATLYKASLIEAGVPMPEAGEFTPEYWDDAAARGC